MLYSQYLLSKTCHLQIHIVQHVQGVIDGVTQALSKVDFALHVLCGLGQTKPECCKQGGWKISCIDAQLRHCSVAQCFMLERGIIFPSADLRFMPRRREITYQWLSEIQISIVKRLSSADQVIIFG